MFSADAKPAESNASNSPSAGKKSVRSIPLSKHRAVLCDVLYLSHRIPRFAVDRFVQLCELEILRQASQVRISWSTLFLKAYAIVSANTPELRRAFVTWPSPRLVEMDDTVGVIAINRRHEATGEDCVCWGRFYGPQRLSLVELQGALEFYQRQPIEQSFKRQMASSHLPGPLRRWLWWFNLNVSLRKRARRVGTFSMSTLAGQQAWNRSHPSLLTTSLTYGPLDQRGRSLVTLLCDHRVLDGVAAANAIGQLEAALQGPIARELVDLAGRRAVA